MFTKACVGIVCFLFVLCKATAQGCASFGFLKYFPRHLNGSETETRANVLVSLTHPGVVTCAAFTPRTVVLPLPTVALIFEPVIDPFVAPENRTSVYNEDPVGRFFLSRSASVNITTASSSTAIPVFVSYLQFSGSRTIHITCAAKCAANSSVTAVSFPVPVMLKSFPGTKSFFFSASTILNTARQSTASGQILDDGAVQFKAVGVPLVLTELSVMMDLPLDIKAFHDIDLTVVFPVRTIDAIFSTYVLGLTDGATVWSLSVAKTGVLAIQWPYYIPFTASYSTQSLLFGQWSGDEAGTTIQIRYQFSRAQSLVNLTYVRGNITQNFRLSGPRAGVVSGPLRIITFSTSITQTYSHYNIHGHYTIVNYPRNTTYVSEHDPYTIASQVLSTEGTFQGMASLPAAVYRASSVHTKLLELPLPAPSSVSANSTTPFQVTVSIADKPAGNNANNLAFGLSDGATVWAAKRTTTLVAGIVVNMTSRNAVTQGPTSQNLQDTTPMCQGQFTYENTVGLLSGATRAAMGWNSWNVSGVVSQGPLSVYVLHVDSTVINHYFVSVRVDVTLADTVPPTLFLRTFVDVAPIATNYTIVPVTVTFSEEVALVSTTLSIHTLNCVATVPYLASNVTTSEMNFTVSPLGDGVFSAWIGSNVVKDSAGNINVAASNVVSFVRDTLGPAVTIIIGAPQFANALTLGDNGTWTVTLVISETPRTFLLSYITAVNGIVTALTRRPDLDAMYGGQNVVYAVSCAPQAQGYVNVSVPFQKFMDLANNVNLVGNASIVFDTVKPSVNLTTAHAPISNLSLSVFTVTFSEHIVHFGAANVAVSNGVVSNVLLVSNSTGLIPGQGAVVYAFQVTAVADGLVTVQIAAGAVIDYAQNPCLPSQTVELRYDSSPPTVYISSHTLPWTNTVEKFTVTFNEWPFGLTNDSFAVENCSVVGITLVSSELGTSFNDVHALNLPTVYEFTVLPLFPECDISLVLRAGGITDRGRNGNVVSNKFVFHFDSVPPTVVITTNTPPNANQFTVEPVFVHWSEPVRHFTPADVTVKRAEITRISQPNGSTVLFWRLDIEAFTPGPDIYSDVRIHVGPSVTQDLAGNGNVQSYNGSVDDSSPRELRFQFHVILPKKFDFVPVLLFCTAFITIALVPVSYFAFIVLQRRYYLKRGVYMEPVEALFASTKQSTQALRDNIVLLQDYPSPFIVEVHAPELLEERKRFLDSEQTRKQKREARRKKREEEEELAKSKPKPPKTTKSRQRGGSKPRPGGKHPGSRPATSDTPTSS